MTEEQVFLEFKRGNVEPVYLYLYKALLLYASRCLGNEMSFMAEDCVQDAIYKAYETKGRIASVYAFKAYLYTCVHNRAMSVLRKQVAMDNYLSDYEEEESRNVMIEQEIMNLLFEAIDALPERYRKVFDLNFEEGLRNADIADRLNMSVGMVKKQKAFIVRFLREELRRKTDKDYLNAILLFLQF